MATSHLRDICFDCIDPYRVAHFWAAVLGYTIHPDDAAETPDIFREPRFLHQLRRPVDDPGDARFADEHVVRFLGQHEPGGS